MDLVVRTSREPRELECGVAVATRGHLARQPLHERRRSAWVGRGVHGELGTVCPFLTTEQALQRSAGLDAGHPRRARGRAAQVEERRRGIRKLILVARRLATAVKTRELEVHVGLMGQALCVKRDSALALAGALVRAAPRGLRRVSIEGGEVVQRHHQVGHGLRPLTRLHRARFARAHGAKRRPCIERRRRCGKVRRVRGERRCHERREREARQAEPRRQRAMNVRAEEVREASNA
mmetsp:Transcript_9490/g.39021  ORF Transcript_9490/g.39021 Transcript_9490/m.39021 type:complete len:236 (+) Transcript_9490:408-1115(+)